MPTIWITNDRCAKPGGETRSGPSPPPRPRSLILAGEGAGARSGRDPRGLRFHPPAVVPIIPNTRPGRGRSGGGGAPDTSAGRGDAAAMTPEKKPSSRPRCRRLMGVRVAGTGSYVPDAVVDNDHLHARLGFDSDWIVKRTGILERRHAQPHQATSDLCVEAARRCFAKAGTPIRDVRPARPRHLHAGHVVPVHGLPGARPARPGRPGRSRSRPPAPGSCTPSSPRRPTSCPGPATPPWWSAATATPAS